MFKKKNFSNLNKKDEIKNSIRKFIYTFVCYFSREESQDRMKKISFAIFSFCQ